MFTHDSGRDSGSHPYDPGHYDPGSTDPGTYDPGIPDPGYDPGYDPGMTDPGHYDPGTTDPGQYDPGVSDPGYDPGATDPGSDIVDHLDCKGLYDCLSDCPHDAGGYPTQACRDECNQKTSSEGHQVDDALTKCLTDNVCNIYSGDAFSKCLDQYCLDEYYHCFSGDTYPTCMDLNECLVSCPKDDPATTTVDENSVCRGDCYTNASYTANWDWEYLRQCIVDVCAAGADGNIDSACLSQQLAGGCYNKAVKCFRHGSSTCDNIWTCINACPNNDSACVRTCYDNGTYTGQYLYSAMISCVFDKCKAECDSNDDTACNSCLNQQIQLGGACYGQYTDCKNDLASRGR